MKSTFLVLLAIALPAQARDLDRRMAASFLSERVPFLSALHAQAYIDRYDRWTEECLQGHERSRKLVGRCLDQAAEQVAEVAKQENYRLWLIHRLSRLADREHLSTFQVPDPTRPTLGIVGDSLATGANADLRLEPHLWKLAGQGLFDFLFVHAGASQRYMPVAKSLLRRPDQLGDRGREFLPQLTRVFDTPRDHKQGFERSFENRGSTWVDCEECSFAYLVGRRLGLPAENIFMAAQIGKRISSLGQQLERLALPLGHLPEIIIVSYTGNDMCNMSNMNQTFATKAQAYEKEMTRELETLRALKPSPKGTQIFVVAAADVGYLVEAESILNRRVEYNYGWPVAGTRSITCRDFRRESFPGLKDLNNMCNLILRTAPENKARIDKVKELHRAVVHAQQSATRWAETHLSGPRLSFNFVSSILQTPFMGEDISNDCFHPSIRGHEKIADHVLPTIRERVSF